MDVTVSELMSNFIDTPLVVWVKTFGPLGSGSEDKLSMFMDLVDGVFLHKIMTHVDPSPTNQRVNKNINNDVHLRIQNLNTVIRHIKLYYQETLQQLILMPLPNVLTIAKDPLSAKSMDEIRRLLLLILGCAVQCERKEEMIEKIKVLDIQTQAAIVSHIQEVTHNQENVLDLAWLEVGGELPAEELDPLSRTMALQLRKLIDHRDEAAEVIVELTQERDYLASQQSPGLSPERDLSLGGLRGSGGPGAVLTKEEKQHLSVELADTKSKLRRSRQELEEKTEQLLDSKHEVERLDQELQRLKQESVQLQAEARSVRVYRDEVDALRDKAARVDRLETELGRCKEKLHDVHFYKTRVEELREDNMTLLETKALLEEQLSAARGRCDKLHELEKDSLQLRSKLHDMEMDRDGDKKRLEELIEENMLLEISQKQSMNESTHLGWELEQLAKNNDSNDTRKSFVFEMNECAASSLLKLEKENQGLQSTIQELRQASLALEETQLRSLELDRDNQALSKKLERLQTLLDQEKQTNQDMESLGEELLKDKQQLEKEKQKLQTDKDRQIVELEQEKQHLSQAVSSLRQRAQADSEARVREVETENRVLHQTVSDTGTKLTRLEAQARLASQELEDLNERSQRCEELEREVVRLERSREALQREVASLRISCERTEELEQENRRLKKLADTAQNVSLRLGSLEAEHRVLEEENMELRRSVETLRPASARLCQLQVEGEEMEKEREELTRALEEMRGQAKRAERLELSCASLTQETQRLQEALETRTSQSQSLERETRQSQAKVEQLRREVEELRQEGKRLEGVEQEKRVLEQELSQSEKDRKQLEKEGRRLRQQLEEKESGLEESTLRLAGLEKEGGALSKELDRLKEVSGRVKELEKENKDLQKQATIDKRTLATLREELVKEKLQVQQQCNELETLSQELEKMGLNREKLLQQEHSWEDNKYRLLESKIESTLKKTLEIREEKIQRLESRLEESSSLNQQLRTELSTVKRTLEALRQRQEEEQAHSQSSQNAALQGQGSRQGVEKWEVEQREATAELLKLKDRLIDIEKNNAALQTEKQLQKEQQRQLASQNSQLNSQTVALQRQTTNLQEQNTVLHTQTAKLQVENSTLSSQSASLMAQNAVLQGQVSALEAESEAWQRQREEARAGREGVLQDHERLLSVHERQAAEYEHLISQHAALKTSQRAVEQEHRSLQSKYMVMLQQKEALEDLEGSLEKDRHSLQEQIHTNSILLEENSGLRGELSRVNQSQSQLTKEYEGLQLHTKELKTSLNSAQLEVNRWQAQYDQLKEQHQGLDISMTKLDNHCELLTRLKGNLEEENHHLLSQIQMLSQQNQTLLERTMESKEHYHEEQKLYIDKLNTLRRQKEKLEEKIMDQYKFYDPAPKKKSQWVGAKALAKLIKPRKDSSSRERVRSATDLPLPDTPTLDYPDGFPPLPPPPLPPRQSRLGPDTPEENHTHNNSLNNSQTSTHSIRGDHGGSSGRKLYPTPGGSSESVNGGAAEDFYSRRRGGELGAVSYSTPSNQTSTPALTHTNQTSTPALTPSNQTSTPALTPGSRPSRRTRGYRPGSAELSHNTSSSNSPVNCRDSVERLQGRSASMSSDDVAGLTQEASQQALPRSSTLPYDPPPQRGSARPGLAPAPGRTRPSSPGSQMVTLEEFLYESNTLSPPTVQTGSREDLMTEYFTRGPGGERDRAPPDRAPPGRTPPLRDGAKTPTSYVTPTLKTGGVANKPGQSVKPSMRLPDSAPPSSNSQTLPHRASNGLGGSGGTPVGRPSSVHSPVSQGGGAGSGLSRTFSLASADLLRSNGPDSFRPDGTQEGVVRRPGAGSGARERPLSARLAGPTTNQHGDGGYSPLAPPLHHSSSLSLPPDRHSAAGGRSGTNRNSLSQGRSTPQQHRGEVAMVTPVRAVPALRLEESEAEGRVTSDSPLLKKTEGGGGGCGTEEPPKTAPSSPDPNDDPQTVWYEYGCV
ncbi:protein Daple isoform X2 [Osmerus mordax]|uniref:protein Daple isoform X2 n=1 Tax=Osmerus mordax TaxID=8014 RepID=UPI003510C23C